MNNIKLDKFCEQIRSYREALGLTQKALAEKIGVTPTTISAYEKKIKYPSLENALAIADALEVTIGELCGETTISTPKTFSDLIQMISTVGKYGRGFVVKTGIEEDDEIVYYSIAYRSERLNQFLEDWDKILNMHNNGIIDIELHDAWLEKQYRKYDISLSNADGTMNDPWAQQELVAEQIARRKQEEFIASLDLAEEPNADNH